MRGLVNHETEIRYIFILWGQLKEHIYAVRNTIEDLVQDFRQRQQRSMPTYCDLFERTARGTSPSAMKWRAATSKAKVKPLRKAVVATWCPYFRYFKRGAMFRWRVTRNLYVARHTLCKTFGLFLLTGDYVVDNFSWNFFSLCMYVKRISCNNEIKMSLHCTEQTVAFVWANNRFYFEGHMKHISGLCEQSTVILNVAAPDVRTYNSVVNG